MILPSRVIGPTRVRDTKGDNLISVIFSVDTKSKKFFTERREARAPNLE